MIIASIGQAEDIDTRKAVAQTIRQCQQQMHGMMPQAGIIPCISCWHWRIACATALRVSISSAWPMLAMIMGVYSCC